jgi:hypothetical protein
MSDKKPEGTFWKVLKAVGIFAAISLGALVGAQTTHTYLNNSFSLLGASCGALLVTYLLYIFYKEKDNA